MARTKEVLMDSPVIAAVKDDAELRQALNSDCQVVFLLYGTILNIAGLCIRIIHTPGHTPGGVCLLVDDVIFPGDTLFAGGCGRSDLGGDWSTLVRSLKRLSQIEGYFKVLPGHGESTTLAYEKRYNPYMR